MAEHWSRIANGTDDASTKNLDIALKMVGNEGRKAKRGRAKYASSGYRGGSRGGKGGRRSYAYGSQAGTWPGYDAYGYHQPQGYGPPQMPAEPGGYFVAPSGPGPAQVVKALGAPMLSGAKAGPCFRCGQPGHLADYYYKVATRSLGP